MGIIIPITVTIVIAFIALWPRKIRRNQFGNIKVLRSSYKPLKQNYAMCGNCHGTGQTDFGLGASWGGQCDSCEGNGNVYMDPSRKSYTYEDISEWIKK